ncbi:type IV pilus biogenesis protein PilM [Aliivibrio fischeri]|uniref:type IV pilus biogenesis protein PilM n=1 Tax=Aliivibrio fischeri TaxID=668 RepID=UPI0007C53C66|nr:type IV pilus assembly protein PilM [Aliivibrio fischeri]
MIYPTITGLDVGHHSIKAVSVRLKKGQLDLVSSFEVLLPESVFVDTNNLNVEELKPYLSRIKKQLKLNQKQVAFSIPDSSITSKVVQIDSQLDERETEFAIAHNFEQHSSFSSDDLNIDYVASEHRGTGSLQTITYQVFATRKDLVNSRQRCFESAGLKPVLADAHSNALLTLWQRAIAVYPDKKNWMLIDIGYMQTVFCIASPSQHLYSKHISFGAVAQDKEANSINEDNSIDLSAGTLFIKQLSEHIHRQVTLYSSVNQHKVEGVWITGGGSMLPGLSDSLSYELSLPTVDLNLLSLFQTPKKRVGSFHEQKNQYASALGLALRGIEWLTK